MVKATTDFSLKQIHITASGAICEYALNAWAFLAGSKDTSVKLEERFNEIGIQVKEWQTFEWGFTGFVLSRGIEQFMNGESSGGI